MNARDAYADDVAVAAAAAVDLNVIHLSDLSCRLIAHLEDYFQLTRILLFYLGYRRLVKDYRLKNFDCLMMYLVCLK